MSRDEALHAGSTRRPKPKFESSLFLIARNRVEEPG
jgi:hypothetical protein